MDERVVQARVGIVVVSAVLLTIILIVLFGDFPTPLQRGKVINVTFASAPGVLEGTPVRKSGILIGRVERVSFVEDSSDVEVAIRLNAGVELRQNEACRINSTSLLGDAVIEFVSSGGPVMPVIADGATLRGEVTANPLETFSRLGDELPETLHAASSAFQSVGTLADNVNKLVDNGDEDRVDRLMTKTEDALDRFTRAMDNINQVLEQDDMQQSLQQAIEELPTVVEDMKVTLKRYRDVADRADRNLANLEGLTEPLSKNGPQIVERIDSSIEQFDLAMNQFLAFSKQLNSGEGTLGELLNNPELYENVNEAAENIRRISNDIRPVINDVRVFTDKIARDPGRLGVSGAIRRRDNTKYPNIRMPEPPPADWRDPTPQAADWLDHLRPPDDWRDPPAQSYVIPH